MKSVVKQYLLYYNKLDLPETTEGLAPPPFDTEVLALIAAKRSTSTRNLILYCNR